MAEIQSLHFTHDISSTERAPLRAYSDHDGVWIVSCEGSAASEGDIVAVRLNPVEAAELYKQLYLALESYIGGISRAFAAL